MPISHALPILVVPMSFLASAATRILSPPVNTAVTQAKFISDASRDAGWPEISPINASVFDWRYFDVVSLDPSVQCSSHSSPSPVRVPAPAGLGLHVYSCFVPESYALGGGASRGASA
ncbi:hypothetical protein B0H12DRAFT_1233198 [Mycena haematopus]|nr:hypothetical protein B0H12DRAFT_1233198 [Mycena haematopus]